MGFYHRKKYTGPRNVFQPRLRVNNGIGAPELRVIDDDGNQIGILPRDRALALAQEKNLDLVEISPTAKPPVAKITDYGKYFYRLQKEDRQKKAKQKTVEIKGIRLSVRIASADLATKARQTEQFLKEGHRVKIDIRLKGREKAHSDLAKTKLEEFIKMVTVPVKVEQEPKKQPWGFVMVIGKAI